MLKNIYFLTLFGNNLEILIKIVGYTFNIYKHILLMWINLPNSNCFTKAFFDGLCDQLDNTRNSKNSSNQSSTIKKRLILFLFSNIVPGKNTFG